MNLRWMGAILVIISCGGFGFCIAAAHRREVKNLQWLMLTLDLMECELQYCMTPLPELCMKAGKAAGGTVRQVFLSLSELLCQQEELNVENCMRSAIDMVTGLSGREKNLFRHFGTTLGQFDLAGQLKGISSTREECVHQLALLSRNQEARMRSYQTLGFCAGAALAILLV